VHANISFPTTKLETYVIVYSCTPIDHHWEFLKTVKETAAELGAMEAELRFESGRRELYLDISVEVFLNAWEEAKELAGQNGWEGDFRGEPRVLWLPMETGFDYGFAFKQDNNGTTFIVTPVRLPWVERFAS
jgi:hypothetical protein